MDRPFNGWLVIGLGMVVALLGVSAGVVYRNTRQLHDESYRVAHTQEVLNALGGLFSTMKDAETGQRGYLITGNERYLSSYHDARAALEGKVARVKRLTEDNDRQQARISRIKELMQDKLDELEGRNHRRAGEPLDPHRS
jgi:CHASE3 domain sensor protein